MNENLITREEYKEQDYEFEQFSFFSFFFNCQIDEYITEIGKQQQFLKYQTIQKRIAW